MKKVLLLLLLPLNLASSEIIKVAVIDTGVDHTHPHLKSHLCPSGHKDFTNTHRHDINNHGTHVAGIIVTNAKNSPYCIISLKYSDEKASGKQNVARMIEAIRYAISQKVKYVNISGGGPEFILDEYNLINANPNITFIVAAGNEHSNIDLVENHYYPASYRLHNIVSVGNVDHNNNLVSSSNYGKSIKAWEMGENVYSSIPGNKYGYMTGTSQSTGVKTGKMIYESTH